MGGKYYDEDEKEGSCCFIICVMSGADSYCSESKDEKSQVESNKGFSFAGGNCTT